MECYIWNTQLAGIWLTSHIWDIGLVLKGLNLYLDLYNTTDLRQIRNTLWSEIIN